MKTLRKYGLLAVGAVVPVLSFATPPATDYDAIVSAVDWADVITGIGAVAALVAAVLVVRRGVRMLLSMIGR
jgi:hypothetical protein